MLRKKIEGGGGYAGEGKEDELRGGGGCENNLKVRGYAGEGTEDKMRGGMLRKKIEGGYAGEGKEDEMRGGGGLREQFEGVGMPERVQKTKCRGRGRGVAAKN